MFMPTIHFWQSITINSMEASTYTQFQQIQQGSSPRMSEVSFDQWVFEVKGVQKSCGEVILQEAITHSLQGTANNSVWYLGPGASVAEILDKLMTFYRMVTCFDILMQQFYGLQQEKGEHVASFLIRIEGDMSDIGSKYPNRMFEGGATRLLWQLLHYGLCRPLQDNLQVVY